MIYLKRAEFSKPWPLSDLYGNSLEGSILYAGWGLLDDVRIIKELYRQILILALGACQFHSTRLKRHTLFSLTIEFHCCPAGAPLLKLYNFPSLATSN